MEYQPDHRVRMNPTKFAFANMLNSIASGQSNAETLLERAVQVSEAYAPGARKGSLFLAVLRRLNTFLAPYRGEWQGMEPLNGVICIEETLEFHCMWSALQWAFCIPPTGNSYTSRQLFGDGFTWVGITILYLLGQRHRFNMLDYSYYLIRTFDIDGKTETGDGINLVAFLDAIRANKRLNDAIFDILCNIMPECNNHGGQHGIAEPPALLGQPGTYVPFNGEHGTAPPRVQKVRRVQPQHGALGAPC